MLSTSVWIFVFSLLFKHLLALSHDFPRSRYEPPVPGPRVRTLDTSPLGEGFLEAIPYNDQPLIREGEPLLPRNPILDQQRWYIPDNQSDGAAGDFPSSAGTADRYYSNGLPAVGPVATPAPDEAYDAQSSSASRTLPDGFWAVRQSEIGVPANGPDTRYFIDDQQQIAVPANRIIQVADLDASPKVVTSTVKSAIPPPPPLSPPSPPVKSPFPPVNPVNRIQQILIRLPDSLLNAQSFPNTATLVREVPVKQSVGVPITNVVKSDQSQTKDYVPPPPPPPPPLVAKNINPPVLISPKAPPAKGIDITGSKAAVPPAAVFTNSAVYQTDNVLPQVKHIWIPTSPITGKFISIPVTDGVSAGKSVSTKSVPANVGSVAVSDTWLLKQDGPLPSFENLPASAVQVSPASFVQNKGVIQGTPVVQISPAKGSLLGDKTLNQPPPTDIWPPKQNIFIPSDKNAPPLLTLPAIPAKSNAAAVGKTSFTQVVPQKSYIVSGNIPPPPPPLVAPVASVINGRPCPLGLHKHIISPTGAIISTIPGPVSIGKSQPLTRIIRINRYPFGSYVLSRRPSVYVYPRRAAIIRQTKDGLVRLIPTTQAAIPFQTKQISLALPTAQFIAPPATISKLPNPVISPQTISSIAYTLDGYPQPLPSGNVFTIPQNYLPPFDTLTSILDSSSSESSSSESESEEETTTTAAATKKPKKPEKSESDSSKEEGSKETGNEESKESEDSTLSEESIEGAESQTTTQKQLSPNAFTGPIGIKLFSKPFIYE